VVGKKALKVKVTRETRETDVLVVVGRVPVVIDVIETADVMPDPEITAAVMDDVAADDRTILATDRSLKVLEKKVTPNQDVLRGVDAIGTVVMIVAQIVVVTAIAASAETVTVERVEMPDRRAGRW